MKRRVLTVLPLAALVMILGVIVPPLAARIRDSRSSPPTLPARSRSPLDPLDRCVQARFADVQGMGIGRMLSNPEHLRSFQPETSEETEAVDELQRQGWQVGFYLLGRGSLEWDAEQRMAGDAEAPDEQDVERIVGKPVFITPEGGLPDRPRPSQLMEHGRRAFEAFEKGEAYAGKVGRWSVEARPVRAVRDHCLRCHQTARKIVSDGPEPTFEERPLKVGDVLGAAIYVYDRPAR